MKILLLNDNPVVRKLVALSAQKTKDELSVVWSVDEVEGDAYDLLIVDDAHYSDDAMGALKEKIQYKTSLLMATRGNATPAGFDKIINKPFLPTDLVDLFAQIDKDIVSSGGEKSMATPKEIDLSDTVNKISVDEDSFDVTHLNEDLDLDDFDLGDVSSAGAVKTNVLDHEEVQELQDLLDDTDSFDMGDDELSMEGLMEETSQDETSDEDFLKSLDDDILGALEEEKTDEPALGDFDEAMGDFDLDEEVAEENTESSMPVDESMSDEDLLGSLDDLLAFDEDEKESVEKSIAEEELEDLDALLMDDLGGVSEEESTEKPEEKAIIEEELEDFDALLMDDLEGLSLEDELDESELTDDALSDDEFGELEQQIQEAVGELGIEELDQGIDELDDLDIADLGKTDPFAGLDDLDSLSERDIKLAVGEEVEEEAEIHLGHGEHAALDSEALSEAMDELDEGFEDEFADVNQDVSSLSSSEVHQGTPAEGIDALQALLKALSNEDVAKTLKGLSINININFGNEK